MTEQTNHPAMPPVLAGGRFGQKKILMLIGVVVVVLVVVFVGLLIFGKRGVVKNVVPQALQIGGGVSEVTLKTEYANPFDREVQYVNPFEEFKSPFQSLQ